MNQCTKQIQKLRNRLKALNIAIAKMTEQWGAIEKSPLWVLQYFFRRL